MPACSARCGHIAVAVDSRDCWQQEFLIVHGGIDVSKEALDDLHVLQCEQETWFSPERAAVGPAARAFHAAAVIGRRVYIFGGHVYVRAQQKLHQFSDLWCLNTVGGWGGGGGRVGAWVGGRGLALWWVLAGVGWRRWAMDWGSSLGCVLLATAAWLRGGGACWRCIHPVGRHEMRVTLMVLLSAACCLRLRLAGWLLQDGGRGGGDPRPQTPMTPSLNAFLMPPACCLLVLVLPTAAGQLGVDADGRVPGAPSPLSPRPRRHGGAEPQQAAGVRGGGLAEQAAG